MRVRICIYSLYYLFYLARTRRKTRFTVAWEMMSVQSFKGYGCIKLLRKGEVIGERGGKFFYHPHILNDNHSSGTFKNFATEGHDGSKDSREFWNPKVSATHRLSIQKTAASAAVAVVAATAVVKKKKINPNKVVFITSHLRSITHFGATMLFFSLLLLSLFSVVSRNEAGTHGARCATIMTRRDSLGRLG